MSHHRHVVLGRKNWLFLGTDDFGEHACTITSLIASAKLHDLDPEAYLRDDLRVAPRQLLGQLDVPAAQ